jgi:Secretion system C-terminal sorting domain/Domain of unknown function (DUF5122) beta-propeller
MKKIYTALLALGLAITANAQSYKIDSSFNSMGSKVYSTDFPNHTIRGSYLNNDGSMVIATQTDGTITTKRSVAKILANGNLDNTLCNSFCTDTATGVSFYTDVFKLGADYYISSTGYGGTAIKGNATTVDYQVYDADAKQTFVATQFNSNTIIEATKGQATIYAYKAGTIGSGYNGTKASGVINGASYPHGGALPTIEDVFLNGINVNALAVQSNNRILVGGTINLISNMEDRPFIARYKPNSIVLDSTFGTNGVVKLSNLIGAVQTILADASDNLFVTYSIGTSAYLAILNTNGTFNTTATNGGNVSIPIIAYNTLLTPQGKILIGIYGDASTAKIVSFNKNGSADNTFFNGSNEMLLANNISGFTYFNFNDIASDAYGNIAISGFTENTTSAGWKGTIVKLKTLTPATPLNISSNTNIKTALDIYPNPATNYLQVSDVQISNNAIVQINTIDGKIINSKIENNKINIEQLDNGIYFITIKDGANIYNSKFTKL